MTTRFAQKIKDLRTDRNWTIRELAEKAKITHVMVVRYESGKVIPTARIIKRLGNALGVSCEELFAATTTTNSEQAKIERPFNEEGFQNKLAKIHDLSDDTKYALDVLLDQLIERDALKATMKKWS